MSTTTTIDNTEIKYDCITKDYAILVDGVAVAYGRDYSEAEAKRTAYLADRDADGLAATATELDGGAVEPDTLTILCPDCGASMRQTGRGATLAKRGPVYVCPVAEASRGERAVGDKHTYVRAWTPDELADTHEREMTIRQEVDSPNWDINNSEYCLAHETWFGRMPCPECYAEKRQPDAQPTCQNCNGPHHTWQCPEIGDLLFAPPHCSQCGDPMDSSISGLCHLCRDWSEPVMMAPDAVTCQTPDCIQLATHIGQYCCYHYSEEVIGIPCDCTDDDYDDAMWEMAHGSYNGHVPDVEYAPFGFAA